MKNVAIPDDLTSFESNTSNSVQISVITKSKHYCSKLKFSKMKKNHYIAANNHQQPAMNPRTLLSVAVAAVAVQVAAAIFGATTLAIGGTTALTGATYSVAGRVHKARSENTYNYMIKYQYIKGFTSGCSLGFVDIKMKVVI